MPFLVLTGEKASGTVLIDQTKLVANNVKGIIVKGAGHWLMEELQVKSFLKLFHSSMTCRTRLQRLAPDELSGVELRIHIFKGW